MTMLKKKRAVRCRLCGRRLTGKRSVLYRAGPRCRRRFGGTLEAEKAGQLRLFT